MNRKSIEYRKERLPYGVWTTPGGRQVMFNRYYTPLFQRGADGSVAGADPARIEIIREQKWFYTDNTPEKDKRRMGVSALAEWGLSAPV
jgi:hypothetical protein